MTKLYSTKCELNWDFIRWKPTVRATPIKPPRCCTCLTWFCDWWTLKPWGARGRWALAPPIRHFITKGTAPTRGTFTFRIALLQFRITIRPSLPSSISNVASFSQKIGSFSGLIGHPAQSYIIIIIIHHYSYYTRMRTIAHDECSNLLMLLQSFSNGYL